MRTKELERLEALLAEVHRVKPRDESAFRRRVEVATRKTFGKQAAYLKALADISFYPSVWYTWTPDETLDRAWERGRTQMVNLIEAMVYELRGPRDADTRQDPSPDMPRQHGENGDVFVVHGHDQGMKETVVRVLERLGLGVVVLHERPDRGRTVIEKLEDFSQGVGFAVALLSPDDCAHSASEACGVGKRRARQNVVFELGFFVGKLGRARVAALYCELEEFELPSDYEGVLYVPFDTAGSWKLALVKELRATGYAVSADDLP